MSFWFLSILSVFIVSLTSFTGLITLSFKINTLKKLILFFVSFAVGILLGDAFFHLLPESFKTLSEKAFLFSLLGIMSFFILEKLLRWRHCHIINCQEHPQHLAFINLLSDSLHNFIDGLMIATSYQINLQLGITTTLAILCHELPQEIGDFGVLIHSGFSIKKALFYNFLSALASILGVVFYLFIDILSEQINSYLIAFTAGSFIYLATSDLVPELHKVTKIKNSLIQIVLIFLGIFVMLVLKNLFE